MKYEGVMEDTKREGMADTQGWLFKQREREREREKEKVILIHMTN